MLLTCKLISNQLIVIMCNLICSVVLCLSRAKPCCTLCKYSRRTAEKMMLSLDSLYSLHMFVHHMTSQSQCPCRNSIEVLIISRQSYVFFSLWLETPLTENPYHDIPLSSIFISHSVHLMSSFQTYTTLLSLFENEYSIHKLQ